MEDVREPDSEQREHLGESLHTFRTKVRTSNAPKRALEVSGVTGAALIPVGLMVIEGAVGMVVAVLGGLVAVTAYLLSSRQYRKPSGVQIDVFEHGVVCSQGDASRQIVWNEVVEISCRRLPLPDGTPSMALVFETVASPPLLIMVGGTFSDEGETAKLLGTLRDVWIPVWCRRAHVLAQQDAGLTIGKALVRCECLTIGDQKLAWTSISGVQAVDGVDYLKTSDGDKAVEGNGIATPFPSAARRIAALAAAPPAPPLLPPARPVGKERPGR